MGWLTLATSLVLLAATVPASVLKAPRVNTHHTFVSTRDAEPVAKDWYESGVFYQIYPRSFKDSNGDGIGDLKGITEKLDHLKDLGVTGTWLSPIFKSPMNDFGYDIEDFYNVDEIFGSNEELAALFARAKELDIKIILDFVPNHSSKSSQWFVQSEQKINGFDDWYVWRDPKGFTEDGEPIVPCNWQSVFYGSAWTWSEVRQQFYLHQFDTSQPDLNFRNPAVVQEMKNILKHWLDLGADGFRVDAINHLFETEEPIDEPLTGNPDPLSYGYTDHIYTKDMPETYEMVYQWRQFLDEYQAENGGNTRIMMTEAYANHEQVSRYYGANGVEGSHMPFNFLLINDDAPNWDAAKIKYEIDNWLRYVPSGKVSNWVLGNHDKPRMATRYGADRVQGLLALEMGLPGVAVTYYGEEIGMENNMDITWKETVDPQACNNLEEFYQSLSRDPSRTPFQWDATVGTGFSTTADTWLPINKNYVTLNLKAQQEAEKSTYKFYKELIELRKTNALIYGGFVSRAPTDNVFMYKRSYLKEHYVFVINRGAATEQVNLDSQYDGFSGGKVVIASTGSARAVGADVNTAALSLAPYEVLVISYNQVDDHMEWYDNAVFYQIYPRSFKDSDGDGVGDLQGIIEGLDHLKDLGVTGTWLSPIFKSPMRDFGYDIEDFYKVDEIFGTNDDLVALFARAKELDIKIILDFVPNHSSNESEWFIQSEQKLNGFDDWYVWRDPKGFTDDGEPIPPTNWLSVFYGPAWTWSPIRQQFYLHQFDKTQPDLNFRNRAVVDQFVDILWFWLDKGADGFRVDAINHLFETEELIDEPVKEGGSKDPLDHNYLDHIYTTNQDETFEMVYHWREVLNLFKAERASNTKLLMTESYTDPEQIMRFYGLPDGTKTGSQMPFNFIMINDVHEDSTAAQIKTIIENWLAIIPEGKSTNWVLGNHDRARVGTRFGTKRIEGFLALEMGLPGIAVTYYGEEIGMENNMDITWEETQDPAACNAPEEEYLINSRDPVRTPFQWDSSEYANFSSGEPWLPVHPNYRTLNLEAQKTASRSIYKFYKQLMELRTKDQFTKGTLKITAPATDVLAYQRFYANSDALKDTYVVVINMGNNERTVNVQDLVGHERATVVLASSSSFVREEAIFNSNAVTLQNYDVVVLQKGSAVAIVVSTFLILASILTTLMF